METGVHLFIVRHPFSLAGAISFSIVSGNLISQLIGLGLIIFALLKYLDILKFKPNTISLLIGGGITGLLSGLIGSAGPIGAAVFLSLGLSPVGYIASEAVTAAAMHITKTIVYQRFLGFSLINVGLASAMGACMILGTIVGKQMIEKMDQKKFTKFVAVLLGVMGITMLLGIG